MRYENIIFRVTEEEKKIFIDLAYSKGMNLSTYIRYVLLNKVIEEKGR